MVAQFLKIGIGPVLAATLGACASYAPSSTPAFAYLPASCSTPGAFPAMAIDPQSSVPMQAGPAAAPVAVPGSPAPVPGPAAPARSLGCLVALPIANAGYGGGYYGNAYRYYDPYARGYGYDGIGSIGIGFGLGGHHGWSGGHGSGHFGGHGHHGH